MAKYLVVLFVVLFNYTLAARQALPDYKKQFALAEGYANTSNPSAKTDALASRYYLSVIKILSHNKTDDAFLLKTYISTGAFMQVLDNQDDAISFFKKAFSLKKSLKNIPDSILFAPYVYCGNGFFRKDNPDSANVYYLKAKAVAEKFPKVKEQERLFNTLGVMAYATGNYYKSIPFYEKAISVLKTTEGFDKTLMLTYQNNLASSLRKLKQYTAALAIYKNLLRSGQEKENLYHNIGSVYLGMNKADSALLFLQKPKVKNAALLNDLARAFLLKKLPDSALGFLSLSKNLSAAQNIQKTLGVALKCSGDAWVQKGQLQRGISFYQYAIQSFYPDFNPRYTHANPMHYKGVFNTIELLETLIAKAEAQRLLYNKNRRTSELNAVLKTYDSFYMLARHISKFYDNDEARLLIGERKYAVHHRAIETCLLLFKLSGYSGYIKKAFLADEENKASTLSLYRAELVSKATSKAPRELLTQETILKNRITRTSLSASAIDGNKLPAIRQQLNDDIIALGNIQEQIRKADSGKSIAKEDETSLKALQQKIPSSTAILSYHLSAESLLCFAITNKTFNFFNVPLKRDFRKTLQQFENLVQLKEGNNNAVLKTMGSLLYNSLIGPAEAYLSGKNSIVIIPDDELNLLPFEELTDGSGLTVLQKYVVTYNYSCKILQNTVEPKDVKNMQTLGFAPFSQGTESPWPILSYSLQEIKGLTGRTLSGKAATKQEFLKRSNQFDIIHLATHALASNTEPSKSYIAFYPGQSDSSLKTRLYLPEVYNLNMQKTKLVILSACESGNGNLVNGEGLMSISRAFSYAGCDNVITSIRSANDASTAVILNHFHQALKGGYPFAEALQKAKLDYLSDKNISPSKKSPAYRAHLRFIGGLAPIASDRKIGMYLIMIPVCIAIALIFRKLFAKLRKL